MKRLGMVGLLMIGVQAVAGPLAVAPVEFRDVPQTYSVEGLVEATRQSTVSAQISGPL